MFRKLFTSSLVLLVPSMALAVDDVCDLYGLPGGDHLSTSGDVDISATSAADYAGWATAVLDFDGDGNDDLAVGLPGDDEGGSQAGAVHVYLGNFGATPTLPEALDEASADIVIKGVANFDFLGWSLANAGDLTGNGEDDMLVGAPRFYGGQAYAALIEGGSGWTTGTNVVVGAVFHARFIDGLNKTYIGASVAGGHVDDGIAAVAVGAPQADDVGSNTGSVYVFEGPWTPGTTETASTDAEGTWTGVTTSQNVGYAILFANTLNDPGDDSLIIGSEKSPANAPSGGEVYIINDPDSGTNSVAAADTRMQGSWGWKAGRWLASAGDVNNDSKEDFWVGVPKYYGANSQRVGAAFLFVGGAPAGTYHLDAVEEAKVVGEQVNSDFGNRVAGGADFNGDGIDDMLVTANRFSSGSLTRAGRAYAVLGPFTGEINAATAPGVMTMTGAASNEQLGSAVSVIDANPDGFGDMVVGSWRALGALGETNAGRVEIFYGGEDAADELNWYTDGDTDGYGTGAATVACEGSEPAGSVLLNGDCNDGSGLYYPGADESLCDGNDYNCDTFTGNVTDNDLDTYTSCNDCDDDDAGRNAGVTEVCDGVDNNCDFVIDENTASDALDWYLDADTDGFGEQSSVVTQCQTPNPSNTYINNPGGDCDDGDPTVNPNAVEICDFIDNDCNEGVDEASAEDANTYYADVDVDTFGDFFNQTKACSLPGGHVTNSDDCDDSNSAIKPGATEICDLNDNDCDGINYLGGPSNFSDAPFELWGASPFGGAGSSLASIADWNADGRDEVLIGAPEDDLLESDAGAVYGWNSTGQGGEVDFSSADLLGNDYFAFRIDGTDANDNVGSAVASGDVNNDGVADVVIGANNAGNGNGAVAIFYGPVSGKHFIDDADVIILGSAGAAAGTSLAVFDISGDGIDDVVWGSPNFDVTGTDEGKVEILQGSASLTAVEAADAVINGDTDDAHVGATVVNLGDIDNDTNLDLGIGAPDHPATNGSGEFYVYYGAGYNWTSPTTVASANLTYGGVSFLTHLGTSGAGVGDVNGDNFDDILLGSQQRRAYLIYGGASLTSGDVDDKSSFIFVGETSAAAAQKVYGVGDVNGDGFDELVISAHQADNGGANAGAAFLIYGRSSFPGEGLPGPEFALNPGAVESFGRFDGPPTLPPTSAQNLGALEGASLFGEDAGDIAGYAVASGDFNGDGNADLIVGAPQATAGAGDYAGKTYGYFGGAYGTDVAATDSTDWKPDNDTDGYGTSPATLMDTCAMHVPYDGAGAGAEPLFSIDVADDCNDADDTIYPGAPETNDDSIDSNCDTYDDNIHRHTGVIDGAAGEYTGDELMSFSGGSFWVTWDNTNLYLAVNHPSVGSGDTNTWLHVYLDADDAGSSTGVTFNAQTPLMAFEASHMIAWRAQNVSNAIYNWNNGTDSWDVTGDGLNVVSGYDHSQSGNVVEIQVPLADLNVTDDFRLHLAWVHDAAVEESYDSSPTSSFAGTQFNPNHLAFHEFSWLSAGVPNSFPQPAMPTADDIGVGDLVISEIMPNPNDCSDSDAEYFEVYNAAGFAVNLENLQGADEINSFTIGFPVVVAEEGYVQLFRTPLSTQCYGFTGDFSYNSNLALNNTGDDLTLSNTSGIIDQVNYNAFDITTGVAKQLSSDNLNAFDNGNPAYWCDSLSVFAGATADKGSPGAANAVCPPPGIDADGLIAGDLVITELMINPDDCGDAQGEYIEFTNVSGVPVDLENLQITTNSGSWTQVGDNFIAAGQRVIAVRSSVGQCYGLLGLMDYSSGIALNNTSDRVVLSNSTIEIDAVDYTGFIIPSGSALQLSRDNLSAVQNDAAANWCPSTTVLDGAVSDRGTPWLDNIACKPGVLDITVGDLVISELMIDPGDCTDAVGEYVELYNGSGGQLDLYGLNLSNGFTSWNMTDTYIVADNDHVVLGRSDLSNCHGVAADLIYSSSFALNNGGATITVGSPSGTLDSVNYTGWDIVEGVSLECNNDVLDVVSNDDEDNWCDGRTVITGATSDIGSPGGVNIATWTNTITVDGSLADWAAGFEAFGSSSSDTSYVTWDATNIYVAFDHPDVATGGTDHWAVIYFQNGGMATQTGIVIGGQTPEVNTGASHVLAYKLDGTFDKLSDWTGSVWNDTDAWLGTAGSAVAESGNVVEFKIPRAAIGVTDEVLLTAALVYGGTPTIQTYNAIPATTLAVDGATDPDWDQSFGFGLYECDPPNESLPIPYLNRGITVDGSLADWDMAKECFDANGEDVCVTWDMDNVYIAGDHSLISGMAGEYFNIHLQGDGPVNSTTGLGLTQVPGLPTPMSHFVSFHLDGVDDPILIDSVAAAWDTTDVNYFTSGPGDYAVAAGVVEYQIPRSELMGSYPQFLDFHAAFIDETPSAEESLDPVPAGSFVGPVFDPNYTQFIRFDLGDPEPPANADVLP